MGKVFELREVGDNGFDFSWGCGCLGVAFVISLVAGSIMALGDYLNKNPVVAQWLSGVIVILIIGIVIIVSIVLNNKKYDGRAPQESKKKK